MYVCVCVYGERLESGTTSIDVFSLVKSLGKICGDEVLWDMWRGFVWFGLVIRMFYW